MKDDLEEKITEFVFQRRLVVAGNRVGDLVSFLDRIRRDRCEILGTIPWTTVLRIAQLRHDCEEAVERRHHRRMISPNCGSSGSDVSTTPRWLGSDGARARPSVAQRPAGGRCTRRENRTGCLPSEPQLARLAGELSGPRRDGCRVG